MENTTVQNVIAAVKATPVMQRTYTFVQMQTPAPKGQQRIIVIGIMADLKTANVETVATAAAAQGLRAAAGVKASTAWHLHQLELLGCLKQTSAAPVAETVVIDFGTDTVAETVVNTPAKKR
jgi:hypothetical protein